MVSGKTTNNRMFTYILFPAHEFDPDRFLDDRLKKYLTPNPFIFLPFNAGPRICLGQQVCLPRPPPVEDAIAHIWHWQFAYNEMSFFLIRLLQKFSTIRLDPGSQPPDTLPPSEWKTAAGRKGIEKMWPKSGLTMYSYVSITLDCLYGLLRREARVDSGSGWKKQATWIENWCCAI
jgi:hypothetical protein